MDSRTMADQSGDYEVEVKSQAFIAKSWMFCGKSSLKRLVFDVGV